MDLSKKMKEVQNVIYGTKLTKHYYNIGRMDTKAQKLKNEKKKKKRLIVHIINHFLKN